MMLDAAPVTVWREAGPDEGDFGGRWLVDARGNNFVVIIASRGGGGGVDAFRVN